MDVYWAVMKVVEKVVLWALWKVGQMGYLMAGN